ncbi:MAG: hypothetical protein QCI38_04070, partial [Candidatus Thermoplasmatota archaeon]|nr:hypothetical protein [Candidatus Thermoplasmatota archaeon]
MRGIKAVFAFAIIGMFLLPAIPSITEGATRAAGDPMEGVHLSIEIYDSINNHYGWWDQETDAMGNYDFTSLPQGDRVSFDSWSPPEGYLSRDFSDQINSLNQDQELNMDLEIFPIPTERITISGYITDSETGNGLAFTQADNYFWYYWKDNLGNSYYSSDYMGGGWCTVVGTDGRGTGYYEFQAPPGDFEFSLAPVGYRGIYHGTFSANADREIDFAIEPEPAPATEDNILLVEVLDSETQMPLEGYGLYWELSNDFPHYDGGYSGNTDADGMYTNMTGPGSGEIIVRGKDSSYIQTHYPAEVEFNMPADHNQLITIELTPIDWDATIQGTLSTPAQEPIPHTAVQISITNSHGDLYTYAMTNDTGFYSKPIPAGQVELRVSSPTVNGTKYYSATDTVNVNSGQTFTADFLLHPVPETSRIYGQVTEGVYTGGPTPMPDDLNGDGIPDTPADPGDTIAPAPITNLAGFPGTDYVELAWTATGDDGTTGSASYYLIGYSTVGVITDIDAANVYKVPNTLSPKAYGASESFTIHGLTPNTQYWFMVVAVDDN